MTVSPRMPRRIPPVQRARGSEARCGSVFSQGSEKQTLAIRGHVVDLVSDAEEEEESKGKRLLGRGC